MGSPETSWGTIIYEKKIELNYHFFLNKILIFEKNIYTKSRAIKFHTNQFKWKINPKCSILAENQLVETLDMTPKSKNGFNFVIWDQIKTWNMTSNSLKQNFFL